MNERCKLLIVMNKIMKNSVMGVDVKKKLYERILVSIMI